MPSEEAEPVFHKPTTPRGIGVGVGIIDFILGFFGISCPKKET
ncbi:hypothetical protein CWRG_00205 [Chthonomonas calidirosea]|nr:hypothetical protein CWRG_00205 [Chthonomonas calidirosea]